MWRGRRRRGGEIVEKRDKQQEGRSAATVPWQQAVEAGKMAAGDSTPGQLWSTAPGSGLLSPHQSVDEAGRSTHRRRAAAAAAAPVSLMCHAGMSDAGPGPNTPTKPLRLARTLAHPTFTHTDLPNSPFSLSERTDTTTPTGAAAWEGCFGNGRRRAGRERVPAPFCASVLTRLLLLISL